jgi:hypothetical protein
MLAPFDGHRDGDRVHLPHQKIPLLLVETQGATPTPEQVAKLRKLADEAEQIAITKVGGDGQLLR